MMNFDQFVSEYIAEDHDIEQLSVMVLEGCRAWYPLAAEAEKQKLLSEIERIDKKLANEGFVSKAPAAVIDGERAKKTAYAEKLATVEASIANYKK